VLEQQKEQNNVSATPSPLKEEESVTTAGTVIVYESTITSVVSNDEVKLTTTEGKEDDFEQKTKKAQNAFQDLFTTAIEKGKSIASQEAKKLAAMDFNPSARIAAKDSADIAMLGPSVEGLARTFEDVMTGIGQESYDEQTNLLTGYEKLLQEQISVINSKIHYVKRLKK
jgi:hypothetical protein